MPLTDDHVRMQVPVTRELADEIEALGKKLRRSQRWMATELLNVVVEDRQSLADHLARQVMDFVRGAVHVLTGKPTVNDATVGKGVHLDLSLPAVTASFVEALAQQLGHTPAKMAGVMLQWGVHENGFAITLIAGPLLAAHQGVIALAEATNVSATKDAA